MTLVDAVSWMVVFLVVGVSVVFVWACAVGVLDIVSVRGRYIGPEVRTRMVIMTPRRLLYFILIHILTVVDWFTLLFI